MKILTFDMATVTGWCYLNTSSLEVISSFERYSGPRKSDVWLLEERLERFTEDLNSLFNNYDPDAVVYEQAHFRGGGATRSAVGMETVLRMRCWDATIPSFPVHSGTLKKEATGSGKASKEDMIVAAKLYLASWKRRDRHTLKDDNEADAICLAHWGKKNLCKNRVGRVTIAVSAQRKANKAKTRRRA